MRIFEKDSKTNFVDQHDVLVGFDSWQSCCESFGYHFAASSEQGAEEISQPTNLEGMLFDRGFFVQHDDDDGWGDGGGQAVFRLVDARIKRGGRDEEMRRHERRLQAEGGLPEVYLVLYNHHNGYYSHGFSMEVGGTVLHSGYI